MVTPQPLNPKLCLEPQVFRAWDLGLSVIKVPFKRAGPVPFFLMS